jgi:hypothetical protein
MEVSLDRKSRKLDLNLKEARDVTNRWIVKAAEYGISNAIRRYGHYEDQTRDEIHCCRPNESIGRERVDYQCSDSIDSEIAMDIHSFDSMTLSSNVDFHLEEAEVTMAFSDLTLDAYSICSLLSHDRDEIQDENSIYDLSPARIASPTNSMLNKLRELELCPDYTPLISYHSQQASPKVENNNINDEFNTPRITNRVYGSIS